MKRHVIIALISSLTLLCSPVVPARTPVSTVDYIVAVVNKSVIVNSELEQELKSIIARLKKKGTRMPKYETLRKQVLERMILKEIQLQEAKQTGIRVNDSELDRAMQSLAKQNNMTLAQFRKVLETDQFDFGSFREEVRERLILSHLRRREVDNRIDVTRREIDNFLENEKSQGSNNDKYHLGHILISVPDAATPEIIAKQRSKAIDILNQLRNGADFAEAAISWSNGQQALEGGDLGWRSKNELPSLFAELVPAMKVGEVSDLIRSPSGFHLIKLLERQSGEKAVVTQTRVRHILIKTNEETSDTDARLRLEQLRERIIGGDDFGDLARSNSVDKGSAAKGGELGWTSPGNLVPEFERMMNSLAIDEISQPFKTQFGWHILQVQGRRDHDSTEEVKRNKALKSIRERKTDEEYQSWLRQLRDEAFVEYRSIDDR